MDNQQTRERRNKMNADMITVRNIIARETDRKKEADTHETKGSVL